MKWCETCKVWWAGTGLCWCCGAVGVDTRSDLGSLASSNSWRNPASPSIHDLEAAR